MRIINKIVNKKNKQNEAMQIFGLHTRKKITLEKNWMKQTTKTSQLVACLAKKKDQNVWGPIGVYVDFVAITITATTTTAVTFLPVISFQHHSLATPHFYSASLFTHYRHHHLHRHHLVSLCKLLQYWNWFVCFSLFFSLEEFRNDLCSKIFFKTKVSAADHKSRLSFTFIVWISFFFSFSFCFFYQP